jgi:DNA-binding IclR family transcriptional regulator
VYTILVQNHVKERIIDVLKQHPEGLTAVDISKILGSHRHTITKYIYQLVGEGLLYQREVGTAKLCYLKEENNARK